MAPGTVIKSPSNHRLRQALELLSLVLLTSGVLLLGFYTGQSDFIRIAAGYSFAFAGYALAIHLSVLKHSWKRMLLLAVVLRAVLIFSFPALSDDVYRFLWDGRLMHLGIHPLRYLPEELMHDNRMVAEQMQEIYTAMNSPHYYTVYPPVAQFVFYVSTFDIFRHPKLMGLIMKLFLFAGELLTAYGLYRARQMFRLPQWTILLYVLNPLVIVETMGSMHFEGLMIGFLIWSGLAMARKRWSLAGMLFALSVGVKLLPLMFLPALFFFIKSRRERLLFFGSLALLLTLIFLPWISGGGWEHFMQSLGLYYRKFEFNAGWYYLMRFIGYKMVGYNLIRYIGPAMGLTALGLILLLSYRAKQISNIRRLPVYLLVIYMTFLAFSLILHPWYLLLALLFTVFVPNSVIPAWSYLISWTYINYSYRPYHENLWVVAVEYTLILLLLIWELRTTRWLKRF